MTSRRVGALVIRVRVHLHHPEDVALGVLRVREPPDGGNRHLGKRDASVELGDPLHHGVEARDVDGAHERVDGLHVGRTGTAARHEPAVDARRSFLAGLDEPVGLRSPLVELPAEELAIERDRPLDVLGLDLEMDGTRHRSLLDRRSRSQMAGAASRYHRVTQRRSQPTCAS